MLCTLCRKYHPKAFAVISPITVYYWAFYIWISHYFHIKFNDDTHRHWYADCALLQHPFFNKIVLLSDYINRNCCGKAFASRKHDCLVSFTAQLVIQMNFFGKFRKLPWKKHYRLLKFKNWFQRDGVISRFIIGILIALAIWVLFIRFTERLYLVGILCNLGTIHSFYREALSSWHTLLDTYG